MQTLGIFCYIKNEEKTLYKSLSTIRGVVDELIVIDTGSTDNSISEAEKIADKIIKWPWQQDFAKASNYGASLLNSDYKMKWDADWFLREGDAEKIKELKFHNFNNKLLTQFSWANEYYNNGKPSIINRKNFAYKADYFYWTGKAHDYLVPVDKNLNKEFSWKNTIEINQPLKTQYQAYFQDILVFHYKNNTNNIRYSQTQKLIDEELKTATGESYERLVYFGVSNCIFTKNYQRAEELLFELESKQNPPLWAIEFYALTLLHQQKLIELEILFINLKKWTIGLELLQADYFAIKEPKKALKMYKNFISKHPYTHQDTNINSKRIIDHPRKMIQNLTHSIKQ